MHRVSINDWYWTRRFDGDTASFNVVYSDNALAEIKEYLASAKFYVSFSGEMNFSAETDTIKYVLKNMTGF